MYFFLYLNFSVLFSVGIFWNIETGNMYSNFHIPVFQLIFFGIQLEYWNLEYNLEYWNIKNYFGILEFNLEKILFTNLLFI